MVFKKKENKFKIKAVIFDIGGVLTIHRKSFFNKRNKKGVHEYVAKKLKVSLDSYWDSIDTAYAESIIGAINKDELLGVMSRNLKTTKKNLEKLYLTIYRRKHKRNRKLYNFALKLKKKGYKISILSDQWPLSKDAIVFREYYSNFNPVIISTEVGFRKPDPKIYYLLLEKLKIIPQEILFIDNRDWNLVTAKKIGMHTILFKDNKQFFKEFKKFGIEV